MLGKLMDKSPASDARDSVDLAWSGAKKVLHLTRQVTPTLGRLITDCAANGSAGNALFALGAANILTLYVNIWMAIGDAYAQTIAHARATGAQAGYSFGFGHQLAGTFDSDNLEWRQNHYRNKTGFDLERALEMQWAQNAGLSRGWHDAVCLKVNHRRTMIQQLDEQAATSGGIRSSWPRGDKYAVLIALALKRAQG